VNFGIDKSVSGKNNRCYAVFASPLRKDLKMSLFDDLKKSVGEMAAHVRGEAGRCPRCLKRKAFPVKTDKYAALCNTCCREYLEEVSEILERHRAKEE
jgi:hypothetical protein